MIRIGIVGFGFMGRTHFQGYRAYHEAEVVAICDANAKLFGVRNSAEGNIVLGDSAVNLDGIAFYTDYDKMLAETNLDAISITLPTHLHCEYTLKALNQGVCVLCEKPIALSIEQGESMIRTAEKNKLVLQIGHCIRFWPEYLKLEEIIRSKCFGQVKSATFTRLCPMPEWSANNWLKKKELSGGVITDLHIHDTDYVNHIWGLPKSLFTRCSKTDAGKIEYLITNYIYDKNIVITSEASWNMPESFGFKMGFSVLLEKALITYDCTRENTLKIFPVEGEAYSPELELNDGYANEIGYFIRCIQEKETIYDSNSPLKSLDSLRLVMAEAKSAQNSEVVYMDVE